MTTTGSRPGPDGPYLHAAYRPPMDTTVRGIEAPEQFKRTLQGVRWRWRVKSFPKGGDECNPDVGDSAAGVFVSFKAGLKVMVIKYVWNATGKAGKTCELANNPFFAKRIIVLRAGGPTDTWHTEEVDPRADFVRYFGGKLEDVPDFIGLAVLTDGDATKSQVEADYADFALLGSRPGQQGADRRASARRRGSTEVGQSGHRAVDDRVGRHPPGHLGQPALGHQEIEGRLRIAELGGDVPLVGVDEVAGIGHAHPEVQGRAAEPAPTRGHRLGRGLALGDRRDQVGVRLLHLHLDAPERALPLPCGWCSAPPRPCPSW